MAEDGAGALSGGADAGDALRAGVPSDAAPGPIAHAFRPTIFSAEHRYVLDGDALLCHDGKREERLALADVVRVRVYAVPSGTGGMLKRTVLRLRSGAKRVLQANSFERFGASEDRADTYRRLVVALLQRVACANPQVEVLVGPAAPLWALWLAAFVGATVVLAASGALAVKGELPLSAAAYLCPLVLLLPLCWRGVAAGRARRADPARLSGELFASE